MRLSGTGGLSKIAVNKIVIEAATKINVQLIFDLGLSETLGLGMVN